MWDEFKNFAFKGNAFDLAVGIIIGLSFGKIVDSMVKDIIMPVIGAITGGVDFSNHFTPMSSNVNATNYADAVKQGAVLGWGNFLTVVVSFIIVAFILFHLVKISNRMKKAVPPPPRPPASATETLLAEIRDSLKTGRK